MTFGSGTGRRLLTIGAVCCAVFGLLVAASAMPMVASESPANDLLGGSDEESASGAALTDEQAAAAQSEGGSLDGGGNMDGGAAGERSGGMPGAELIQRAAASDNPLVQKALYGLASLASLFGGPTGAVDAGGDPAAAGVDGEFGTQLDSPAGPAAHPEISGDGSLQGDTGTSELEDGSGTAEPGGGTETGTETDGGGETVDGAESDSGSVDEGSTDGSGTETDGSGGETGSAGSETDGQSSDGDTGSEPDPNADGTMDGDGATTDGSKGATDPNTEGGDDGTAETSAENGNEGAADDESSDEDAGLEDAVPGLSDGTLTAVLAVFAVAAVGYVFYTRDDPIGTLRSIPSRFISLALSAVVACSQGLERAVARLRELRSIADLPGLVLETLVEAIRSTTTRVRSVGASLSPFGDADATDSAAVAETQITARERIRQAFASVIDAAPMYRASVATATPAEVARRASDAGAPAEPVETITDSFRDVEYGDRDPESYLDRTTSAHDRLRSALEAAQAEAETGADSAADDDEATANPTGADGDE